MYVLKKSSVGSSCFGSQRSNSSHNSNAGTSAIRAPSSEPVRLVRKSAFIVCPPGQAGSRRFDLDVFRRAEPTSAAALPLEHQGLMVRPLRLALEVWRALLLIPHPNGERVLVEAVDTE